MGRQPPPGLPDAHRDALTEFFHGHLSAGQLTERLRDAQPAPEAATTAASEPATTEMPAVSGRRRGFSFGRGARGVLLVAIVAGGGVAAGMAVGSHPQLVAAQTHRPATSAAPPARTTAPPPKHTHAARPSHRRTHARTSTSATPPATGTTASHTTTGASG